MVFAHCVPSKWPLSMSFKLLHTPQIHCSQCHIFHIFHIFPYDLYLYIHNFSSIFSSLYFGVSFALGPSLDVEEDPYIRLVHHWDQFPGQTGRQHQVAAEAGSQFSPAATFSRKKEEFCNFVPLSSTTADLMRFSHSSWDDIFCQRSQIQQLLIGYRWAASVLCQ